MSAMTDEVIGLAAALAVVSMCLIYSIFILYRVSRKAPGIVSRTVPKISCHVVNCCSRAGTVAPADDGNFERKSVVLATLTPGSSPDARSDNNTRISRRKSGVAGKSTVHVNDDGEHDWEIDPRKLKLKYMIGKGNFGEVWLATWLGSPVAVKTVLPELQAKEKLVKRFIDEIMLMSTLHHPNVVMFLGACLRKPHLCLVMEYCVHGSLHHFLKSEAHHGIQITMSLVYRFALDIARGVYYLHRRCSIVQRDLKARNILVDQSLNAKVADFGLSRVLDEQENNKLTACGTPAWTAPEIVKMERYTEKVDVYSFGIILWEILTRQEPYGGQKGVQIAYAAAEQGLRPTIPTYCPPEYAELMKQCWANKPSERPTFQTILKQLFGMKKASDAAAAQALGNGFGQNDSDEEQGDESLGVQPSPPIATTRVKPQRHTGPAIATTAALDAIPENEADARPADVGAKAPRARESKDSVPATPDPINERQSKYKPSSSGTPQERGSPNVGAARMVKGFDSVPTPQALSPANVSAVLASNATASMSFAPHGQRTADGDVVIQLGGDPGLGESVVDFANLHAAAPKVATTPTAEESAQARGGKRKQVQDAVNRGIVVVPAATKNLDKWDGSVESEDSHQASPPRREPST